MEAFEESLPEVDRSCTGPEWSGLVQVVDRAWTMCTASI